MNAKGRFLDLDGVVAYFDPAFTGCAHPRRAAQEWCRVHRVRRFRVGKRVLFLPEDLDAAALKAAGPQPATRSFFRKARAAR